MGPGQMIAVDLLEGEIYDDRAIKDRIAGERPYGELIKDFLTVADLAEAPTALPAWDKAELTRRQVAANLTLEDLELILAPMVEDAKEAIGSMGDDTPLAVISDKPRTISHFFRQNFSQVTNPPIDPLRERHVMSLKTRFSNLHNILEEGAQNSHVLVLESPVVTSAEWARLKAYFGPAVAEIDCTFPAGGGQEQLRAAIARIREEAEQAVREGRTEIFLTDEGVGPTRAAIAGPLVRSARHPLFRGADRRGRDHGERLSGRSQHRRSPQSWPVRRPVAGRLFRTLSHGDQRRPAQDHVQNGHRGHQQLSRRL
jgi:glutamate synthase (NADPH/NADH) large chain